MSGPLQSKFKWCGVHDKGSWSKFGFWFIRPVANVRKKQRIDIKLKREVVERRAKTYLDRGTDMVCIVGGSSPIEPSVGVGWVV